MLTLTHGVVAAWAAAIGAVAHRTGVRAVRAAAGVAFVVVNSLIGAMLAVNVTVMQVVNMVTVQHRFVSTPWAVGMAVLLGLCVLHRGHDVSLSSESSDAYMRSYECQGAVWYQECDRYRSRAGPVTAHELR